MRDRLLGAYTLVDEPAGTRGVRIPVLPAEGGVCLDAVGPVGDPPTRADGLDRDAAVPRLPVGRERVPAGRVPAPLVGAPIRELVLGA